MRQRQIQIAPGNFARIGGIAKTRLFGKGVGAQPINQPFAPAGDDGGLRVMHMGIHKTRQQQGVAMVDLRGHWIGRAQLICTACGNNFAPPQHDGAIAGVARRIGARLEWVGREFQDLAQ